MIAHQCTQHDRVNYFQSTGFVVLNVIINSKIIGSDLQCLRLYIISILWGESGFVKSRCLFHLAAFVLGDL